MQNLDTVVRLHKWWKLNVRISYRFKCDHLIRANKVIGVDKYKSSSHKNFYSKSCEKVQHRNQNHFTQNNYLLKIPPWLQPECETAPMFPFIRGIKNEFDIKALSNSFQIPTEVNGGEHLNHKTITHKLLYYKSILGEGFLTDHTALKQEDTLTNDVKTNSQISRVTEADFSLGQNLKKDLNVHLQSGSLDNQEEWPFSLEISKPKMNIKFNMKECTLLGDNGLLIKCSVQNGEEVEIKINGDTKSIDVGSKGSDSGFAFTDRTKAIYSEEILQAQKCDKTNASNLLENQGDVNHRDFISSLFVKSDKENEKKEMKELENDPFVRDKLISCVERDNPNSRRQEAASANPRGNLMQSSADIVRAFMDQERNGSNVYKADDNLINNAILVPKESSATEVPNWETVIKPIEKDELKELDIRDEWILELMHLIYWNEGPNCDPVLKISEKDEIKKQDKYDESISEVKSEIVEIMPPSFVIHEEQYDKNIHVCDLNEFVDKKKHSSQSEKLSLLNQGRKSDFNFEELEELIEVGASIEPNNKHENFSSCSEKNSPLAFNTETEVKKYEGDIRIENNSRLKSGQEIATDTSPPLLKPIESKTNIKGVNDADFLECDTQKYRESDSISNRVSAVRKSIEQSISSGFKFDLRRRTLESESFNQLNDIKALNKGIQFDRANLYNKINKYSKITGLNVEFGAKGRNIYTLSRLQSGIHRQKKKVNANASPRKNKFNHNSFKTKSGADERVHNRRMHTAATKKTADRPAVTATNSNKLKFTKNNPPINEIKPVRLLSANDDNLSTQRFPNISTSILHQAPSPFSQSPTRMIFDSQKSLKPVKNAPRKKAKPGQRVLLSKGNVYNMEIPPSEVHHQRKSPDLSLSQNKEKELKVDDKNNKINENVKPPQINDVADNAAANKTSRNPLGKIEPLFNFSDKITTLKSFGVYGKLKDQYQKLKKFLSPEIQYELNQKMNNSERFSNKPLFSVKKTIEKPKIKPLQKTQLNKEKILLFKRTNKNTLSGPSYSEIVKQKGNEKPSLSSTLNQQ